MGSNRCLMVVVCAERTSALASLFHLHLYVPGEPVCPWLAPTLPAPVWLRVYGLFTFHFHKHSHSAPAHDKWVTSGQQLGSVGKCYATLGRDL